MTHASPRHPTEEAPIDDLDTIADRVTVAAVLLLRGHEEQTHDDRVAARCLADLAEAVRVTGARLDAIEGTSQATGARAVQGSAR